jgi:hypothetical protein
VTHPGAVLRGGLFFGGLMSYLLHDARSAGVLIAREVQESVGVGDFVRLHVSVIAEKPPWDNFDLWVRVTAVEGKRYEGMHVIPSPAGDMDFIRFRPRHVMDVRRRSCE